MDHKFLRSRRDSAFSIIELVVVISILVVLTGILTPYVMNLLDKAKVQAILQVYETVSKAVHAYKEDIQKANPNLVPDDPSLLPIEDSRDMADSQKHQLFYDPGINGWKGPYLTKPLSGGDHPYGYSVVLSNNLDEMPGKWRMFTGSNIVYGGTGAFIFFTNVPDSVGQKINDALDANETTDWKDVGKVRHFGGFGLGSAGTSNICIFILDSNGRSD